MSRKEILEDDNLYKSSTITDMGIYKTDQTAIFKKRIQIFYVKRKM